MKKTKLQNITLSADGELIKQARAKAFEQDRSLNEIFREWLQQFARPVVSESSYFELMNELAHVSAGRKYNREEMNER